MKYKDDWEETKRRFMAWWHRSFVDRPLLRIIAKRREPLESLEPVSPPQNPEEYHLDVERKVKKFRNFCRTHLFLAEAFPSLDVDLGPGSMATYLGAKPVFAWDTVWYIPCLMGNLDKYRVSYQEENPWWENISIWSKELAGKDFLVNIPDIMESVDVLASLRGPQELVYDLIDSPSKIQKLISELDRLYPHYYQSFYDVVTQEGGSSYTVFPLWGPGKVAKIQCDFSALMSPRQFRKFAIPLLQKQCQYLDYSLYHLDGIDAIKHLEALLEIKELDALQWTAGFGKPDGESEEWYPIYDKTREKGKALWIQIEDSELDEWLSKAQKLIKRYGVQGMYFLFPVMEEKEVKILHRSMCPKKRNLSLFPIPRSLNKSRERENFKMGFWWNLG